MRNKILLPFLLVWCSIGTAWNQNQPDLYSPSTIQEIRITFAQPNWRDILDSLRYNGSNTLAGSLEVNKQKFDNANVRYRSARAFQIGGKRNSLYIQLGEGQSYQGHTVLELSNALRDPSMIREVLGYEIAGNYMPAPRANYARVYINGNYYGLFVNIESVEGPFLDRYFGDRNGELYHASISTTQVAPDGCNPRAFASLQYEPNSACYTYAYDRINTNSWNSLIELTRILNQEPDKIEQILDVDRTLWLLAFNNVMVNLSSYTGHPSQNYYLYRASNGKFTIIPGDLNFIFGSFKNIGSGSDLSFKELVQLDPLLHAQNPERPLLNKLLSNETWRKLYLSHVRTILYNHLVKGQYEKRATALQEFIKQAWLDDQNKEYNLSDFTKSINATVGQRSRIPGVAELMSQRAEFLQTHSELKVLPPDITNVRVEPREKYSPKQVTDFRIQAKVGPFARKVTIRYRFSPDEPFQEVAMLDDGNSHDGAANDDIFGVEIKPINGAREIEYYIVAENARLFSFDPPNYMYQRHRANLDDLNK